MNDGRNTAVRNELLLFERKVPADKAFADFI